MNRVGKNVLWASCLGLCVAGCDFQAIIAMNDGGSGGAQATGGGTAGGGSTGGGGTATGGGSTGGGSAGGGGSSSGGGSAGGGTAGGGATGGGFSGGGGGGACVPITCQALGQTCGVVNDRCGSELTCGSCAAPLSCGGGGAPKVCGMGVVQATACSPGGWCWVTPLPQGNTLFSVWARTATDWWAVGASGTVLHGNGSSGSMLETGVTDELVSVSGSAADDVWAVGRSALIHWNGSGWSHYPFAFFQDVYVASPTEAWATGNNMTARHWDGTKWNQTGSFGGNSIWGASASDVWVVGRGGVIHHWDGVAWSTVPSGTTEDLWSVRGRASNDVWAGGDNGTLLHWTGNAWQPISLGTTARLSPLWPASANRLFIGSSIWDGQAITSYPSAGSVASVGGSSATDVWGVGAGGNMAHFDGASWTAIAQQIPTATLSIAALWASGPTDIRIGSTAGTLRWNGTSLIAASTFESPPVALSRLWGPDTSNLWAASGRLHHWDATLGWVAVALPVTQTEVFGVAGSSPSDVWVWGVNAISHWDGVAWSARPFLSNVFSMISFSANDAWAVGALGSVKHWNGAAWSSYPVGIGNMRSVWGPASDDIWAAGEQGLMLHWDGASWTSVPTGVTAALQAVSGHGSSDVWAVGERGTIIHWDGSAWTESVSRVAANLYRVVAVPDGGVWVSGQNGAVLRRP